MLSWILGLCGIKPEEYRLYRITIKGFGAGLVRVLDSERPILLGVTILFSLMIIIGGAILRNPSVRAYVKGYHAFQIGMALEKTERQDEARQQFYRAIDQMENIVKNRDRFDHQDVIHCILFTAMSRERLGEGEKAETLYRLVIDEYPYSRYLGEAYVKIGRLKNMGRKKHLEQALSHFKSGQRERGRQSMREAIKLGRESLDCFGGAIREDPTSSWAGYGSADMARELEDLKAKREAIASTNPDKDILDSLDRLIDEYGDKF
jgi:tetratricopeptide (TPR) repeat protein